MPAGGNHNNGHGVAIARSVVVTSCTSVAILVTSGGATPQSANPLASYAAGATTGTETGFMGAAIRDVPSNTYVRWQARTTSLCDTGDQTLTLDFSGLPQSTYTIDLIEAFGGGGGFIVFASVTGCLV